MNKIFNKVPVQIQNRSGFDLSHSNFTTLKCGTLTPLLVDTLIPGDNISLGHLTEVQLPPMAADFYGRVQFCMETFFVPLRLCYGGFEQFITYPTNNQFETAPQAKYLPRINLSLIGLARGSLADHLGFKGLSTEGLNSFNVNNSLPFVAYHLIWDRWYRDSLIQKSCFTVPYESQTQTATTSVSQLPYVRFYGDSPDVLQGQQNYLADGVHISSLRQRCWAKDYFTNCKLTPQNGNESILAFNVENNTGSFSISSLRAANSIQQWMERNNLAGNRYIEQIRAQYGVTPSDAILDRPVYLGSHRFDIYNKSVYQSNTSDAAATNNPMNSVGVKYSSPLGTDSSSLVDSFEAKEFGFIFVIGSVVPDAVYASGQRRYMNYSVMSDFANPILSSVGDQEVYTSELSRRIEPGANTTFGYSQRYSEYKFMLDEVHGELQEGGSLSAFALQRTFTDSPELSSSFLEIPTDYMDQVTAVSGDMSKYGAWAATYFTYKKSSVLPAYSIPTLGEPKDTHTELIDNGGVRL